MSTPVKSRTRAIKDVKFTDGHVWIHGNVQAIDGNNVEIDDGTGTMAFEIITESEAKEKDEEIAAPTIVKGELVPGVFVRVIGDVIADTTRNFKLVPTIIVNLDELGIDKDLFARIRSLEEKYGDET